MQVANPISLDSRPSSAEDPQFLLVCINTKHYTVLEHFNVSPHGNDQHMFKQIRDAYRNIRGENEWRISLLVPTWLSNLWYLISAKLPSLPSPLNSLNVLSALRITLGQIQFQRIASADFVRVCRGSQLVPYALGSRIAYTDSSKFQMIPIGKGTFPGWFQKRQFPPKEEVWAGKYLYEPVPMDDVDFLEIPLSHLLEPGDHLDNFWIKTFPKKLCEPLIRKSGADGQRVIGWGIRINEELNWRCILLLILGVLVATGISVVAYAAITSDNSSAFGMGAYLAAVFTTFLTYQYFAWKDEVLSNN